jgi:hypothetical protein
MFLNVKTANWSLYSGISLRTNGICGPPYFSAVAQHKSGCLIGPAYWKDGQKIARRVTQVLREEMNAIGAQVAHQEKACALL